MGISRLLPLVLALGLTPLGALAQSEPDGMEFQRCIWRCLYGPGNGNAASRAYNACVARVCGGEEANADPTSRWKNAWSGGTAYGGVDAAGQGGSAGLYLFCDGRAAQLVLVGRRQMGPMVVSVDGRRHALAFDSRRSGWAAASITGRSAVVSALASGSRAEVQTPGGRTLWRLSLTGSGQVIRTVMGRC